MQQTAQSTPRKRIQEMEVFVADVIRETPDTTTLVLFTGNDRLDYRPGHFCTIDPHQFPALANFTAYLEEEKGKRELPRAYSLTSAPHERHLAITIKEERFIAGTTLYPPLLSPLLVQALPRGSRLVITGFTGPYTLPDDLDQRTEHVLHLVAGSGSVPNFSMVKHSLIHHPTVRHTFVYSNKTYEDICFREHLDALEKKHPGQLKVVHTLTRQEDASVFNERIRKGRVDGALLKSLVPDPTAIFAYLCGPAITPWERRAAREKGVNAAPRFLEAALAILKELGVPERQIRRESYG